MNKKDNVKKYGKVDTNKVMQLVDKIQKLPVNEQAEIINTLLCSESLIEHIWWDFKSLNPNYTAFWNWFVRNAEFFVLKTRTKV